MRSCRQNAFTLIEVLIVVVIMAVLAATIIPQFTDSAEDARNSTMAFNLKTMRSQIELYKLHHATAVPTIANDADGNPSLPQLYSKTDVDGVIGAAGAFGPYVLDRLPNNPLNGDSNVVTASAVWPPAAVTAAGGWFYNAATGQIAPNADGHLTD